MKAASYSNVLAVIVGLVGAWFALFPMSAETVRIGGGTLGLDCGVPVLAVFSDDTPTVCERPVRQRAIVGGVLVAGAYGLFKMAENKREQ